MAIYNLRAYFKGEDLSGGCIQYCVRMVPVLQDHAPWIDIDLAGDEPFTVQYETQNTPFEPLMKSRATIRAVASDYFMDLYGPDAQHTEVVFTNEDTGEILWRGWLTNNLMNQSMDGCIETFNMEAIDCLSSLEYFDYVPVNGETKQIVTFQQIMSNILQQCGNIEHLYVDNSIENESGQTIHLDQLKISEQNFFSSDTDEPWTMLEVLEEMCRYCGYTAVQWKNDVYLFDRQAHAPFEWVADTDINTPYPCDVSSGNFLTYQTKNAFNFYNCTLHQDDIKGTGADISLETIYNKVTVQDSFYEIGDFIPDMYDDDMLENVKGDFWIYDEQVKVKPQAPIYVDKKNSRERDATDKTKDYYQRRFKHKWYSTIYRAPFSLAAVEPYDIQWDIKNAEKFSSPNSYPRIDMVVYNCSDEDKSVTVTFTWDTLTVTRTKTIPAWGKEDYVLTGATPSDISQNAYFSVGSYGPYQVIFDGAPTDNYQHMTYTRGYVGANIVDLGTIQKADEEQYNFEVESKLDFDRFIMISQQDQPDNYYCNPRASSLTPTQLNFYFPPVMQLNSGWTKPIIIDDKCYLSINGSAIYERYTCRDYINDDWTSDCTGIMKEYNVIKQGLFTGLQEIYTQLPCLVFKLKAGGWWWDGKQWTSSDRPFYVDLHTPTDDDGFIDFSAWWNTDLGVINNVPWTDWTGVDGYKIPLTGVTFDWNQEIEFSICLPNKIQVYTGIREHDGMNSYCWLKDFKMEFATKGQENYDLADVIYENVIDEYSVNELSDITLKFTTYPNEGQHSYSNVGYNNGLLDKVVKLGLDDEAELMEEQIVKKYVNQYNTNTISQNMTLNLKATPISRIKDTENGKFFHVCGLEIDYAMGSQRVHMIESKQYNQD